MWGREAAYCAQVKRKVAKAKTHSSVTSLLRRAMSLDLLLENGLALLISPSHYRKRGARFANNLLRLDGEIIELQTGIIRRLASGKELALSVRLEFIDSAWCFSKA